MPNALNLRCDHRVEPLGIDGRAPFLSWALADMRDGMAQAACQVLVATDPSLLAPGRADYWDSGRLETPRCHQSYAGTKLPARAKCWWTVRIWDGQGNVSVWASPARFELA